MTKCSDLLDLMEGLTPAPMELELSRNPEQMDPFKKNTYKVPKGASVKVTPRYAGKEVCT